MADSGIIPWSLTMNAGSLLERTFTFTLPLTAAPYPLTGITAWEYVCRVTATDTGTPLISITTTTVTPGVIAVTATSSLSQVLLTINPVATVSLTPQQYYHALWSSPGTTSAFCWVSGNLIIAGTAQP